MRKFVPCAVAGTLLLAATAAASQDYRDVILARQGQFYILEYNLKLLEDMAASRIPYERDVAVKRAQNIKAVTIMHQDVNWLPASVIDGVPRTRVRNLDGNRKAFVTKWRALMKSADALLEVAQDGPPMTLGVAAANTRATCMACHDFYRPGYGTAK